LVRKVRQGKFVGEREMRGRAAYRGRMLDQNSAHRSGGRLQHYVMVTWRAQRWPSRSSNFAPLCRRCASGMPEMETSGQVELVTGPSCAVRGSSNAGESWLRCPSCVAFCVVPAAPPACCTLKLKGSSETDCLTHYGERLCRLPQRARLPSTSASGE
jgi:hypothetical protein